MKVYETKAIEKKRIATQLLPKSNIQN